MELAGDPFDVHAEIRSLIAVFPLSYQAALVEALAADGNARARQSAVGFLLAPDEPLALAAARGLAASAARGALDSDCRRRIEMIRAWLAPSAREALDAAIPPAAPAAPRRPANSSSAIASVCDGSGAAGADGDDATRRPGTRSHR